MSHGLILGGLNTAANAMSFGMRYLAMGPDIQEELRQHPDRIKGTAEWLLRPFAFVNIQKSVVVDSKLDGVAMKAGEIV